MDIVKVVSNYTKNIKDLGELKKKILNDQNNEGLKTHYILILKESLNNFSAIPSLSNKSSAILNIIKKKKKPRLSQNTILPILNFLLSGILLILH